MHLMMAKRQTKLRKFIGQIALNRWPKKLDHYIEIYFDFLYQIVNGSAKLEIENDFVPGAGRTKSSEPIHSDIIDSLKANGYLLLYNLTESIIRRSIDAIKYKIELEAYSFDELREELKTFLAKNLKHSDIRAEVSNNCHPSLSKIIINKCFNPNKSISGNVDQKAIKELAKNLGIKITTENSSIHKGGRELKTIKDKRNDLSHGNYSFIEVGKNTSIDEMISAKIEVIAFLEEVLENIEDYLKHKEFLSLSSSNV